MAGKKAMDGIEDVVSLFPQGSAKAIQRLLKRAQDKDAALARRNVSKALRGGTKGGRLGSKIGRHIAGELAKAVRQRGAPRKEAPSIRQKASAAQGGGKPFHFAHSVVTKADATAPAGSRASKGGKASAHMHYIEREAAVEGPARASPDVAALAEDLAKSLEREAAARDDGSWDRGLGEVGAAGPGMGSAAAAQGYVENPVKLANGENVVFSFGNIGDRFEDRFRFWTALEEAEAHPGARVQHRLIVELPHEATPENRFEIVKTFAAKFEADGVPYWAALHAPGKDNDSRNFHAHIVYSERPAKRVIDEADGQRRWDFEVIRVHVKASRNRVERRPLRQNKMREYTERGFIPAMRKRYSEIANSILARDDVKDALGGPVRYDHRSYKDMGVDATPMKSVNRIVADRLKDGRATVLDGDYTRKMVAAEIHAAARARDKRVLELIALDKALMDVVREPAKAARVNPRLPKALRVSPLAMLSKGVVAKTSKRLMETRHAAIRLDVMEKATAASLTRIIEATEPKTVAAAGRAKDPLVRAAAPDPATAALLHEAAKEELAETRAQAAKERRTLSYATAAAVGAWQAAVAPFRTEASPTMKAAMRAVAEERRSPGPNRTAEHPQGGARGEKSREEPSRAEPAARVDVAGQARAPSPDPQVKSTPKPTPHATAGADAWSGERAGGVEERKPVASGRPGPQPKINLAEVAKLYADALLRKTAERASGAMPAVSPARANGRVPTLLEAQAASMGVSAFIKRIGESTSSVEERMALLQNWTSRPIFKATPVGPAPEVVTDGVEPVRTEASDPTDQPSTANRQTDGSARTTDVERAPPARATPEPGPGPGLEATTPATPPRSVVSATTETTPNSATELAQTGLGPAATSGGEGRVSMEAGGSLEGGDPTEERAASPPTSRRRWASSACRGSRLSLYQGQRLNRSPDRGMPATTRRSRPPGRCPVAGWPKPRTRPEAKAARRPNRDRGAGGTDVAKTKRDLVVDYAIVLVAYKAWGQKAKQLASLVSLSSDELWAQAHRTCLSRYRQRHPADIEEVDLKALHRETWRAARAISFRETSPLDERKRTRRTC